MVFQAFLSHVAISIEVSCVNGGARGSIFFCIPEPFVIDLCTIIAFIIAFFIHYCILEDFCFHLETY